MEFKKCITVNLRLKNLLKGLMSGSWNWVVKITIPIFIFNYLMQLSIMGVQLYTEEKVSLITYWIIAFGLISTALAVFIASSPKNSIRHAIGALLLLFVNGFYLYVYKFSGAVDFQNIKINLGPDTSATFSLNLDPMIYLNMGVIGLNFLVALWDLLIAFLSPIEEKEKTRSEQGLNHISNTPLQKKEKMRLTEKDQGLEQNDVDAYSF
ncbi:hypothetical protein WKT22_00058 [Candidatus Lokiarchaeum ossiferum]